MSCPTSAANGMENWQNPAVFNTVHIAGHTVEWADGQDIAPHELYDLSIPASNKNIKN